MTKHKLGPQARAMLKSMGKSRKWWESTHPEETIIEIVQAAVIAAQSVPETPGPDFKAMWEELKQRAAIRINDWDPNYGLDKLMDSILRRNGGKDEKR